MPGGACTHAPAYRRGWDAAFGTGGCQVIIRAAVAGDAAAIALVHTRAWQHAYRGLLPDAWLDGLDWRDRRDGWSEELERPTTPGGMVLVAIDDQPSLVGFAAIGPNRDEDLRGDPLVELYAIYLSPELWHRGIGTRLLTAALDAMPSTTAAVTLWVLDGNERGLRFYRRHGFSPDGTTRVDQLGGRHVTELRLRRSRGVVAAG